MENYLKEAFQKLSLLEQDFDMTTADKDKIDKLESFVADDINEIPEEEIIDVNAEKESELADNYIGKIILECDCCHSRIYKDEEEVIIDEESGLANIEETCPVCNNEMGYTVIGKIEPFEADREFEEEPEEEIEVEGELEESLNKRIKRAFLGEAKSSLSDNKRKLYNFLNSTDESLTEGEVCPHCGKNPCICEKCEDESLTEAKKTLDDVYADPDTEALWNAKFDELVPKTGKAKTPIGEVMRCFSRVSHAFLQNGDMLNRGYANRSTYDAANDMLDALDSLGDRELYKLFENKIGGTRSENAYDHYLAQFYETFVNRYLKGETTENESLTEGINNFSLDTDDTHMEMQADDDGKVTVTTEPIFNANKDWQEPGEDLLDDEEFEEESEEIVPITDEEEEKIKTNSEDELQAEEETDEIEDFDEESFDEIGESFLKKVYSNVKSFKTSDVESLNEGLKITGTIQFNSGKTKNTTFMLENKRVTKRGKLVFEGYNNTFSKNTKAFTLRGVNKDSKFVCEDLTYNYSVKQLNESNDSTVIKVVGRVKR